MSQTMMFNDPSGLAAVFTEIAAAFTATDYRELPVGTSVEYSMFHDRGTSHLPLRMHVGLAEPSIDQLTESVAD